MCVKKPTNFGKPSAMGQIYRDTLYVLKLKTPDHWYIGTTNRIFESRMAEHLEGRGSVWAWTRCTAS